MYSFVHLLVFIDGKDIPEDESIIISGDWNIDLYKEEKDNIKKSLNVEGYEYEFATLNEDKSHCKYSINRSGE